MSLTEKGLARSEETNWINYFKDRGVTIPPLPSKNSEIIDPMATELPKLTDYTWGSITTAVSQTARAFENDAKSVSDQGIQLSIDETPPQETEADLAIPCFPLAKIYRNSPQNIASEIVSSTQPIKFVADIRAEGPYINFELDYDSFGEQVLHEVESQGSEYGRFNEGEGKTVVIDYSSPNIAKYMSIGHLRSTAIGESLKRLYWAAGYKSIGDNHIGDWGTQFGMLGRAIELWGDEEDIAEKLNGENPVQGLYELYVRMNEAKEKESELEEEGRAWFRRLEKGDPEALELLNTTTAWSLEEFQRLYKLLGTKFEYVIGESYYVDMLPQVIQSFIDSEVAENPEEELVIVPAPNDQDPPLIIQTKDGRSLYGTRDLATLASRTAWFDPEKIIYVVGNEQTNYFKQVFDAYSQWTGEANPEMLHVGFGMVRLPEGKMSTRKGRVFFLENAIDELVEKAKERLVAGELVPDEEIDVVAQQIGVSALIFLDLHQGRERNIDFNPDEALSLEGNTGPYIQYTYARAQSLIRKADEQGQSLKTDGKTHITLPVEKELIKKISKLPTTIKDAVDDNQPSILAHYLLDLTYMFNSFYNQAPIAVEEDNDIRNTRLRLTQATAQVIKNGLYLLSIETPERM